MNAYSLLDKMVHRLAFCTPKLQLAMADMEETFFARDVVQKASARPLLITSLPRAGTTVLLNALHSVPGLAAHLYRDMPFVLAPVLWARMSRAFQRKGRAQQRAHGDGIHISYDSPEAFDEIIWHTFWPEKYGERIALWQADDAKPEATQFFHHHMNKIISLRCGDQTDGRYISKNNGNIARLALIPHMFPDAVVLVPVRHPLAHAGSLLRQHLNFLKLHQSDPFIRRYMEDIGHLEFGALHRPVAFPGFENLKQEEAATGINYWLAYWIAAFDYVKSHRDNVTLVSYERLCRGDTDTLTRLCEAIRLDAATDAPRIAAHFRPGKEVTAPGSVSKPLLDQAMALYTELNRE